MASKLDGVTTHEITVDGCTYTVWPFKWNQQSHWLAFITNAFDMTNMAEVVEGKTIPKPQYVPEQDADRLTAMFCKCITCIGAAGEEKKITDAGEIKAHVEHLKMETIIGIGTDINALSSLNEEEEGN